MDIVIRNEKELNGEDIVFEVASAVKSVWGTNLLCDILYAYIREYFS